MLKKLRIRMLKFRYESNNHLHTIVRLGMSEVVIQCEERGVLISRISMDSYS